MSLMGLVLTLVAIGAILYLIQAYAPIDAGIKKLIWMVGMIVALLFILQAFGILDYLRGVQVPKL